MANHARSATIGSHPELPLIDVVTVLERLRWMREQRIWPKGLRYLWTDAFGVVLLDELRIAFPRRARHAGRNHVRS